VALANLVHAGERLRLDRARLAQFRRDLCSDKDKQHRWRSRHAKKKCCSNTQQQYTASAPWTVSLLLRERWK
jgi:hypothetical protein